MEEAELKSKQKLHRPSSSYPMESGISLSQGEVAGV
jgi:hypothetical protein